MLDYVRRENDPESLIGRTVPQHKVLGKKILEVIPPADLLDDGAASCNRRAQGKLHAVEHPRNQHPADELRVHPDRLQMRPETRPSNRTVWTSGNAHARF